jgi:hypothetical protein
MNEGTSKRLVVEKEVLGYPRKHYCKNMHMFLKTCTCFCFFIASMPFEVSLSVPIHSFKNFEVGLLPSFFFVFHKFLKL